MNGPLSSHDWKVHHNEEKPFGFRCYHLCIFLSPAALIVFLGIVCWALIVLYLWAHCGLVAQPCTILADSVSLLYCSCSLLFINYAPNNSSLCQCVLLCFLTIIMLKHNLARLTVAEDSLSNSTSTRTKLQCCYMVWTTVYGVIGLQCCQLVVALCLCTELMTTSFFTLLACIPAMHSWRCLCTIS